VFARAREKARQASCQSNMKQIGIAVIAYMIDYDGKSFAISWDTQVEPYWKVLNPYIKNDQVWACPTVADDNCKPHCWLAAYRGRGGDIPGDDRMWSEHFMSQQIKDGRVQNAAGWLIMSEGGCAVNGWTWEVLSPGGCDRRRGGWDGTSELHNGGRNGMFYDGHVKWIRDENFDQYPSDVT